MGSLASLELETILVTIATFFVVFLQLEPSWSRLIDEFVILVSIGARSP